jgi:diadenosine tetraphosphate (Ap4A) HIT family hydrolase
LAHSPQSSLTLAKPSYAPQDAGRFVLGEQKMTACPLCDVPAGAVLWKDAICRVVNAGEPDYPGFLRVILNAHIKEMTDLPPGDQQRLLQVVLTTEAALREVMAPDKINLASLGNVVPHLHWHVIPRFVEDPHFPNPVWGARLRDTPHGAPADLDAQLVAVLTRRLARAREME